MVSGVNIATQTVVKEVVKGANSEITRDAFLKLLVTQLTHQDPLSPLKNEEFISQMAQLQTLEENRKLGESTNKILLAQELAAGSSLLGHEVEGFTDSELVSGIVDKVEIIDGRVLLSVDGHQMKMNEIKEVS